MRRQRPLKRAREAVPALLVISALLLAGCGRPGAPAGDTAATSGPADAGGAADSAGAADSDDRAGDPDVSSDADLVSAVDPGGPTKAVSVKFRIEARPVIGTPVKILVAVTLSDDKDISGIHGSFSPGDGLLMQSPGTFDITDTHAGTPHYQEVTVVPQQTGVLNLNTTLLLQSDQATQTRTYSIPLIVADNSGS